MCDAGRCLAGVCTESWALACGRLFSGNLHPLFSLGSWESHRRATCTGGAFVSRYAVVVIIAGVTGD